MLFIQNEVYLKTFSIPEEVKIGEATCIESALQRLQYNKILKYIVSLLHACFLPIEHQLR